MSNLNDNNLQNKKLNRSKLGNEKINNNSNNKIEFNTSHLTDLNQRKLSSNLRNPNREKSVLNKNNDMQDIFKSDKFKETDSSNDITSVQKRDFADKLKDELNELKTLTKEANTIISYKNVNHNLQNKNENRKNSENYDKTIGKIDNFSKLKEKNISKVNEKNNTQLSGENDLNNSSGINSATGQEKLILQQEFEDMLNYIINKLDIINKITQ